MAGGSGTTMPELVPPMLPAAGELSDAADPERWAVEFGWNGHRCVAYAEPGRKLRLLSSTARSVAASFPELHELTGKAPPGGMVLDGVVVALDEAGRPSRGPLLRRTATLTPDDALRAEVPVGYVVTDLLWSGGQRVLELPYRRRRALLEQLDLGGASILVPPSFGLDEADLVARTAEKFGLDELNLKRLDVPYQPGRRTRNWLRVPLRRRRQVLVAGYLPAYGPARAGGGDRISAVLLALPAVETADGGAGHPGELRYVGRVGVGAADADARTVVAAPASRTAPADVPDGIAADAVWLQPGLVAAVEHRGRTATGRLALPSWRGLVAPDERDEDLLDAMTAARRLRAGSAGARPGASGGAASGGSRDGAPGRDGAGRPGGTGSAASAGGAGITHPGSGVPDPDRPDPDRTDREITAGEGSGATSGTENLADADHGGTRPGGADHDPADPVIDGSPGSGATSGTDDRQTDDHGATADRSTDALSWHDSLSRRLEQHFVYNTLNTIASLVRTDPPRARELLLGFADLSRAADRAGEDAIRLDEELAAVSAYLQIERTRFGARLDTTVDDPRAAGVDPGTRVLPLSVLAAVRRAVQERIEPEPGGGAVHVRVGSGSCTVETTLHTATNDPVAATAVPLAAPGA
ncbi:histidine kinase [Pseudonocardia phyllosphaerae]|uniref:histidine kinase n=1 Tax=Pseudonocardia phyllosphaerae TaxID=3390502 RepID=UPI00397AADDE